MKAYLQALVDEDPGFAEEWRIHACEREAWHVDSRLIARLREFVAEATRNLSAVERRKIRPQLRVVDGSVP